MRNRSMMRVLGLGCWLTACVDTAPLDFVAPPVDAAASDANALSDAELSSCEQCVRGETSQCTAQWEACEGVAPCTELMLCAIPDGCYAIAGVEERIACFGRCLDEHGVMSADHPALIPGLEVNACAANNCLVACGGREE